MAARKRFRVSILEHGPRTSAFQVKLETNKPREAARAATRFARAGRPSKVEDAKQGELMSCHPIEKGWALRSRRAHDPLKMTAGCRVTYGFKRLLKEK
jgi:transposase